MPTQILHVEDLRVEIPTLRGAVHPLNGFSLGLDKGERLGIVGESGSGKTIAAWAMLGMAKPPGQFVGGRVLFRGQDLLVKSADELRAIRGKDLAMITTNPRSQLNPVFQVGEQIAQVDMAHTEVKREVAWQRAIDTLEAVGIPDPVRRARAYPHEFSGGMAQRVLIAIALICSPEVLITDDATNGLDVTVQAQVLDLIDNLVRQIHSSVVMMTHDLGIVAHYCDRVGIMYAGRIVEMAPVRAFFQQPLHPYSLGLLSSIRARAGERRSFALVGPRIDLRAIPTGCPVHPRCPLAIEICQQKQPEHREVSPGRWVSCHRAEDIPTLASEAVDEHTAAQS